MSKYQTGVLMLWMMALFAIFFITYVMLWLLGVIHPFACEVPS